jgi:hypothetical protein
MNSLPKEVKNLIHARIALLELLLTDIKKLHDVRAEINDIKQVFATRVFERVPNSNEYNTISTLETRAIQQLLPTDFHTMFADHAVLTAIID